MIRWLKFNAVGILGASLQLAVLAGLLRLGMNYPWAVVFAVEAAVAHNYVWHTRWTWAGRERRPGRLLRFHMANGTVSVLSNLAWMQVLTGWLGVPAVPANVVAIGAMSLVNFALGDRWVF